MPGTTAAGTPYAEPADPLVQWPATSQQVAEAIDARATTTWVDARLSGKSVTCALAVTDANGNGSLFWPQGFFAPSVSHADGSLTVMLEVYYGNIATAKAGYFASLVSADALGCTFVAGKVDGGTFVGTVLPVMVMAVGTPA